MSTATTFHRPTTQAQIDLVAQILSDAKVTGVIPALILEDMYDDLVYIPQTVLDYPDAS
jgi:hypothetical protein